MGFMRTSESNNADAYSSEEQRWSAVLHRDSHADGQFYYSVRTTGVYCRPSCPSRPALRKNVNFHRVFKSITGLTPKAFAAARHANRVRDGLPKHGNVTDAIYDAGFDSLLDREAQTAGIRGEGRATRV